MCCRQFHQNIKTVGFPCLISKVTAIQEAELIAFLTGGIAGAVFKLDDVEKAVVEALED